MHLAGCSSCEYTCACSCLSFMEMHRLSNLRYSATRSAVVAVNHHSIKMPKYPRTPAAELPACPAGTPTQLLEKRPEKPNAADVLKVVRSHVYCCSCHSSFTFTNWKLVCSQRQINIFKPKIIPFLPNCVLKSNSVLFLVHGPGSASESVVTL